MHPCCSRGECLASKTVATYYHAQLGLPDKEGRAIKVLVVWDGYLDKQKVRGLVPCCGQDGYRAQVPQLPIDSYKYHVFLYLRSVPPYV